MKSAIILVLAILVSTSALAGPGNHRYQRGLQKCIDEAESTLGDGLVLKRFHLVKQSGDHRTYYLNGTRWVDHARVAVGAACTTIESGEEITAFETIDGRFVKREEGQGTAVVGIDE